MQFLRRPQEKSKLQTGSPFLPFRSINFPHQHDINTKILRSMSSSRQSHLISTKTRGPERGGDRVPTYPCPRPRDGCSQMTGRRGAQDEDLRNGGAVRFRRLVGFGISELCCARLLAFMFACGGCTVGWMLRCCTVRDRCLGGGSTS